jgi:PAS domain S-box-containing protein
MQRGSESSFWRVAVSIENATKICAMNNAITTVLLIEKSPADAKRIVDAFNDVGGGAVRIDSVQGLSEALEYLGRSDVDLILLGMDLSESQGLDAFNQVFQAAPDALILLLSEPKKKQIIASSALRGTDGGISEDRDHAHRLPGALRYVIDRRAMRWALRNNEARFRAISDASPLGIFVSDSEGNCIYTNAAYQEISGLSLEEALGTNWSTAIHPEDRDRVLAEWHGAQQNQEPFETEFRFLRRDDSVVWTRVNSSAMRDGDNLFGVVQTVENITERKSAEYKLRLAEEALSAEKERAQVTLNSIGDAVLSTDSAGKKPLAGRLARFSGSSLLAHAKRLPIRQVAPSRKIKWSVWVRIPFW